MQPPNPTEAPSGKPTEEKDKSQEKEKPGEKGKHLAESMPILFVSAACYLAAFFFELGYARHFGIPAELIIVDVRELLLFGSVAVAAVVIVYQFVNLAMVLHGEEKPNDKISGWRLLFNRHLVLVVLPVIIWLLSGHYVSEICRIFGFNFFWIALDLAGASAGYFFFRKGFEYALAEWLRTPNPQGVTRVMKSDKAKEYLFLSMLLILMLFLSSAAGLGIARTTKAFAVDQKGWVLLRRYGESLIFGELSSEKGKLQPILHKISISSVDNFTVSELGPFFETQPLKVDLLPHGGVTDTKSSATNAQTKLSSTNVPSVAPQTSTNGLPKAIEPHASNAATIPTLPVKSNATNTAKR